MVSRVLRATPPKEPAVGLGRIKESGCTESFSMRVLSPRMEPLERSDDGSIANTASFPPFSRSTCTPNSSMLVDLPAPGTPLIPTRILFPLYGRHLLMTSCALAWWSGFTLSTKVTACERMVTSPLMMPSTISPTESSRRRKRLRFK